MSEWKRYKLSEIASLSNGINFDKSAYTSGVKLIGVADFKDRIYPDYNSLQEVDPKVVRKGDYLERGDIVFVRSNGNKELVGRCMMIDQDIPVTYSGFCIKLRLMDKNIFEPIFFNYLFRTRQFRKAMTGTAVGANIQNLSQSRLGNCEVRVPNIEEQREIATILSRYDSLIENYQKQIKLLEEAAQRLYKEWFVDLNFPGHENTKIVDGVPEGWAFYRIDNVFKTVLGGTPSRAKSNYWGGNIPWINSGEINKLRIINPSEMITKEGYDNSATKLMPIHTTILAITGATLGQVSYTEIETCANQSVVGIIDESKQMNEYLYLNISNNILSIVNKATGGAQQHINKDIVNAYPFLLPSKDVLDRFKKLVAPMFRQIKNNLIQIESLIEARDRLLPKLMSGEIAV